MSPFFMPYTKIKHNTSDINTNNKWVTINDTQYPIQYIST